MVKDLSARGWQCILRTEGEIPETLKENVCYVVDTTGELKDWTALADVAVIGKSFLADGGQNPAEAVACGVPVLTGPHMENFDALVQLLEGVDGITRCGEEQLPDVLKEMLDNPVAGACAGFARPSGSESPLWSYGPHHPHDLHHAQDSRLSGGASVVFSLSSVVEWRGRA